MVRDTFKRNGRPRRDYGHYRSPLVYSGSKIKKKKEFHFSVHLLKPVLYFLSALVILYVLFFSSIFRINDIIIEGNHSLSSDKILENIPTGQNIFRFKSEVAKANILAEFPELKDLEIYRGIPNALKIVVLERDGKIVWQSGDKKYLVSSDGEVGREIIGDEDKNLPLVVDQQALPVQFGSQLVSTSFIAFITNVYATFYEVENIKPVNFTVSETTFDVDLYTDGGFFVKLNSLRSSKKQLENLKSVLVEKRADIHEYVDLRIDGWAYYK